MFSNFLTRERKHRALPYWIRAIGRCVVIFLLTSPVQPPSCISRCSVIFLLYLAIWEYLYHRKFYPTIPSSINHSIFFGSIARQSQSWFQQRKGRRPLHRVLASEGLMAVATDDDEDVEEMQGYRIGRIGSASCKEDRLDQMGSAAGTRSSLVHLCSLVFRANLYFFWLYLIYF